MTALAYYLLKVIICSGVLFLYYQVALKNQIFHHWNRFYLLATVVLSLLLPLMQIMVWHTTKDSEAVRLILYLQSADNYLQEITVTTGSAISFSQWVLMGYCLICVILLYSLLTSLLKVFKIIRTHTLQLFRNIKFINTKEPGTPFSFLDFIIWNDEISLQSETGQQIFQHELVHVKEKHTFDKLFMQVVLIFFWCNPFFWVIRRELKFIHEFIADKKAVGHHGTEAFAAMILQSVYPQHYQSITNQFFQTSIKRRLVMLTKIQNKKLSYLTRLIALPLVAITIFAFTVRTRSAQDENKRAASKTIGKEVQRIFVDGNDTIPKSKKEIATIDIKKEKEINTITIAYKDGTSETLTEKEANSRGLIHQGGFANNNSNSNGRGNESTVTIKANGKQPIYILDGKEVDQAVVEKVDPKMIESVNVLKDKSAIDKHGEKGKNGVVEINLKPSVSNGQIIIKENDKVIGSGTYEISPSTENIRGVETPDNQDVVFEKSETAASVDQEEWRAFLEKNLSAVAKEVKKTAPAGKYTVNLKFIVNKDGTISHVTALNNPGYNIPEKVMAIMKYAPKWRPAVQNERTVRSYHTQPISIVIN